MSKKPTNKMPAFSVGPKAKRELRSTLIKSTNPAQTISDLQKSKSLHSMFAKAFNTTPLHEIKDEKKSTRSKEKDAADADSNQADQVVESLDTDSVMKFLNHLGVRQFEVHKRLSDILQKTLEEEIRKTKVVQGSNDAQQQLQNQPLLNLLKSSWTYATTMPELRPVLFAVLKQLGDQTPLAVLKALGEKDDEGSLKHPDIFRPLPPLLKRLVWEADWEDKVPYDMESTEGGASEEATSKSSQKQKKLVQSTLLYETVRPLLELYSDNETLNNAVSRPFVFSARERRMITTQRRALISSGATVATATKSSAPISKSAGISALTSTNKATSAPTAAAPSTSEQPTSGKAVSQIRQLLGDTTTGTASYRPKLIYAFLSMLMATHSSLGGSEKKTLQYPLIGPNLHCTLVADILLSAGGALPKAYQHLLALARTLDEAVNVGDISAADILKIQTTLRLIYRLDEKDEEEEGGDGGGGESGEDKKKSKKGKKDDGKSKEESDKSDARSTFLKRQLNMIITSGLAAMKESDPQSLFLNPVTDEIAPGYSKVITKPMSISTMEEKIDKFEYSNLDQWEKDVRLMFKNCVDYNRGPSGQWFRGEANRQLKVFRDEILSQAKKLYQAELAKRNSEEAAAAPKRKHEEPKVPTVSPLESVTKKRKKETQHYIPSMPALASMLLADPFVVRLLVNCTLRCLRVDVVRSTTIPAGHALIASLLQLLYMAQASPQFCANQGRKYTIPMAGLVMPDGEHTELKTMPFKSLRTYLPAVTHLLLEADLDKRLVVNGDLHSIQGMMPFRAPPPTVSLEQGSSHFKVALSLLEASIVFICLPGNSQEASLATSLPKFSSAFKELSGPELANERSFFLCMTEAILRHKIRLNRKSRDTIIEVWTGWLRDTKLVEYVDASDDGEKGKSRKKKKRKVIQVGSMFSACHEYLVHLLNEWAALGNLLMPRDLLVKLTTEIVAAVDESEASSPHRQFSHLWNSKETPPEFEVIKEKYDRMLSLLPEANAAQWKEQFSSGKGKDGDDDEPNEGGNDTDVKMEDD